MIQYIIIRRDLPFGTTLAQVAHAAADSTELWVNMKDWMFGIPKHDPTIVAILGVRDVMRLRKLEYRLRAKNVPHVAIRESDAPWNGQLMAIGVCPGDRELLSPLFVKYQSYKEFEGGGYPDDVQTTKT